MSIMDDEEMMEMSWNQKRFRMVHWGPGVGMCAPSSPRLFGGRDRRVSSNMLIYPDLAQERAQHLESPITKTSDSRLGGGSLVQRCLLLGSLVLTLAILVVTSTVLLTLSLQDNSHLHAIYREKDSLSLNVSHNIVAMKHLREETQVLAENLSSLLYSLSSIREKTLSGLILNQTEILQETGKQSQLYQMELQQYIHLQQSMENIRRSYLLIPQDSPLLQNCQRTDQDTTCLFCSAGWHLFGLSCYLVSSQTRNWLQSLHWCREQGAHLVVINSLEEQEFLKRTVKTSSWIGLSDRDMEGQWKWVDGTPYNVAPKFWFQKQPDNLGNEDCAVLLPGSMWNDDKCRKLHSSVCEYKAGELLLPDVPDEWKASDEAFDKQ